MVLMLRRILLYTGLLLTASSVGGAQPDVTALGPPVGSMLPSFAAVDQFGRTQTLDSVMGPQGAMVVLYRSADW
jgi:hypothetical protein